MFVLAEDQYGVGDSVDLGYATGEVERITLRSVRLRDGEGKVWHVAHGNVVCVANLSKSSIALLDLELSRDSDLGVVEEVVGRIGAKLRDDPSVGSLLTGDAAIVGLNDIRDDRLIYRISAPTLPGSATRCAAPCASSHSARSARATCRLLLRPRRLHTS